MDRFEKDVGFYEWGKVLGYDGGEQVLGIGTENINLCSGSTWEGSRTGWNQDGQEVDQRDHW